VSPVAHESEAELDVIAIGDAIVDVIATCDDDFLAKRNMPKGSMRLLDPAEADELYAAMGPGQQISGGSAANTLAGIAALGLDTAFVGQIADDQLGEIFAHDLAACGVRFDTPPLTEGPPTGRCLILVTPDAQRTMSTCPGASHTLTPAALDKKLIEAARITYLEGYLWGPVPPRAAMLEAARIARSAGRNVAFTLSESLCIGDRREGVLGLLESGVVDVLFGNEHEVANLTGSDSLAASLEALEPHVATLVVTRGAKGALARFSGLTAEIDASPVERVVDTTGAGDQFAAGFLAAVCRGRPVAEALEVGSRTAAEVISHFGARPQVDLSQLVEA